MSLTVTLKAFQLSGFSFAGGTATLPASARTHVGVRVSDNAIVQTSADVNVDRTVIWLATCTTNTTDVTLCIEHDPLIQIELGELGGAVGINPDDLPPTLLTGAERLAVRQAGAWARTTAYDIAALASVGTGNLPVSEYTAAAVAGSSTIALPAGIFNFAAEFSLYFDAAYQGANTYTYDALTSAVTLNAPIPAGVDTVHVLPRGGKGDRGDTGVAGAPGANGASATVGVAPTITGAPGTSARVTNLGTASAAFLQFTIPRGDAGFPGADATVAVGTTTTLPAGSNATVENTGTPSDLLLNFGIPQGPQGEHGDAATVTVGTTTTLPAGSAATVTNVGTSSAAVFDFGIPQGQDGAGTSSFDGAYSSLSGLPTLLTAEAAIAAAEYGIERELIVALGDETTALTTGTSKVTIRAPYKMTLTRIPRSSLSTASSSGLVTTDINIAGASVLGTNKLSVDATEKTSVTAATATTLATTAVADNAEITFDIDAAGTGAKGLKVVLYYKRTT